MNWREFLTDAERERYDAIPAERKALTAEARLIYGRCLKRMERAGTNAANSNHVQTAPANPQES